MTKDEYLHKMRNFAQVLPTLKSKLSGDFDSFCVLKLEEVNDLLDWSFYKIFEQGEK